MLKKILIALFSLLILWLGSIQLQRYVVGAGKEGLFKIGHCYRDDEHGILYRITGTVKNSSFAVIVESSKSPNLYEIGNEKHWPSSENPQKLYPTACP